MKLHLNILLILLLCSPSAWGKYVQGWIMDSTGVANVRTAPSLSAPVARRIYDGIAVFTINKSGKWHQIALTADGPSIGYVHESRIYESEWEHNTLSVGLMTKGTDPIPICDSPNGKVLMRKYKDEVYEGSVDRFEHGWWHLTWLEQLYDGDGEDREIPLTNSPTGYWVHSSNLFANFYGDTLLPITLLSEPGPNAGIMAHYDAVLPFIYVKRLLAMSEDNLYVKVELTNGAVGWVARYMLCYSYYTNCVG